jgi:hypothetical protein
VTKTTLTIFALRPIDPDGLGLGTFEDVIGLAVVVVVDREMLGAVAVLGDESAELVLGKGSEVLGKGSEVLGKGSGTSGGLSKRVRAIGGQTARLYKVYASNDIPTAGATKYDAITRGTARCEVVAGVHHWNKSTGVISKGKTCVGFGC